MQVTTHHRLSGTFMRMTVHQDFDTPEQASWKADWLRSLDDDCDLKVGPIHCVTFLGQTFCREA